MRYLILLLPFCAFANEGYEIGKKIAINDMLSEVNSRIYYTTTNIEFMEENDMHDTKYHEWKGRLYIYDKFRELIVNESLFDDSI